MDTNQIKTFLYGICLSISIMPAVVYAQFDVYNEHVFNSDVVGIYTDDVAIQSAFISNEGTLHFQYEGPESNIRVLDPVSRYWGPGTVTLSGESEYNVLLDSVIIVGSWECNNEHSKTRLYKHGFEVDSVLVLNGDNVILEMDYAYVKVNNSYSDAVQFTNTPGSNTYIRGKLIRSMINNIFYLYPVGDENHMYLFGTKLPENQSNQVGVRFNNKLVTNWLAHNSGINGSDYELQLDGGWEVDGQFGEGNDKLDVTAYKHSFSGITGNDLVKFARFDPSTYPDSSPVLSEDQLTFNASEEVTAKTRQIPGYFALGIDKGFNPAIIPNFIVGSDGYHYHFIIPGIESVQSSRLQVYDRWGQEKFNEGPYHNQLDTRDLPQGTYYYVLTYDKGKGSQTYQSFFEVYK